MFQDLKQLYDRGSLLMKIIYINIIAFVLTAIIDIFFSTFDDYLALPGRFGILLYRPWTLVSYMFMHAGFMHIFFNLIWLFWFGQMFISFFNKKQLLAVYLIGGFIGAFLHLAMNTAFGSYHQLVGASAAVMSIVFAVSAYKPNMEIMLLFIGRVKLKYLALVIFLIDLIGFAQDLKVAGAASRVAHVAHLGGSVFGIWFGYMMRSGKDVTAGFNRFLDDLVTMFRSSNKSKTKKNKKSKSAFIKNDTPRSDKEYNENKASKQDEINRILDKISKHGYDSLTKKEKEFLFKQKK